MNLEAIGYLKTLFPALICFFEQELTKAGGKVVQNAMDKVGSSFYKLLKSKFTHQELLESVRKNPRNEKERLKLEQEVQHMVDQNFDKIQEKIIQLGEQMSRNSPSDNMKQDIHNHASNIGVQAQKVTGKITINNT